MTGHLTTKAFVALGLFLGGSNLGGAIEQHKELAKIMIIASELDERGPEGGGGGGGGMIVSRESMPVIGGGEGGNPGAGGRSAFPPGPPPGPKYQEKQSWPLHGTTPMELLAAIKDHGYAAMISINPVVRYGTRDEGGVGVTPFEMTTELYVTLELPGWSPEDREQAPKCLQEQWNSWVQSMRYHEGGHIEMNEAFNRELARKVAQLPPASTLYDLQDQIALLRLQTVEEFYADGRAFDLYVDTLVPDLTLTECSD